MTQNIQEQKRMDSNEHILACLSSAPSNAKIIRTAARMANAFDSQFTALFVETPDFSVASKENKERLQENRKLAEQLGANIETVYGEDIPYQIAEFARISGITRIVLGRSAVTRRHLFGKPTLTELLLSYAPDIDIHIIPDKTVDTTYHPKKAKKKHHNLRVLKNVCISLLFLLFTTLLSLLFHEIGFTRPNIIMVYILGVLLTSIATSHQVYSLISSVASVFVFNYLFTEPRFSLTAYETGYPVTFVVMFLTAYITGTFAIRYKEQARESTKIARRTKILFDTDQMLSKAHGRNEIIHVAAEQIMKLLGRSIVIFDNLSGRLSEPILFHTKTDKTYDWEKEQKAAEWALKNNHAAGATTELFPESHYLYLAIRVNERVYGVIGIDASSGELEARERIARHHGADRLENHDDEGVNQRVGQRFSVVQHQRRNVPVFDGKTGGNPDGGRESKVTRIGESGGNVDQDGSQDQIGKANDQDITEKTGCKALELFEHRGLRSALLRLSHSRTPPFGLIRQQFR